MECKIQLITERFKSTAKSAIDLAENKAVKSEDLIKFIVWLPSAIQQVENGYPICFLYKDEKKYLKRFTERYLNLYPDDKEAAEIKKQLEI